MTEEIINIVLKKLKEYDNPEIKVINIVLGKLASFVPESIEYYFPFMSKGTPIENAKLNFVQKNIVFLCKHCQKEFEQEDMIFKCPDCSKDDLEIISGRDFYIESIEVNNRG